MQWITGKATRVWISLNEQTRRTMFIFLAEAGKLTIGRTFMSLLSVLAEPDRQSNLLPSMCLASRVTFISRTFFINFGQRFAKVYI